MIGQVQSPLPPLARQNHSSLCEALEASPGSAGYIAARAGAMLDIAKRTGSVRINRYEQQKKNRADMDTAGGLARALDVPSACLFAESDDLAEVILAFSKLNKAQGPRS